MKILNSEVGIFSDPHYGIHRNGETWHKIALQHAQWAADTFKVRGIRDIIIPGDVFHDRNDIAVNTLHVVTKIFEILKDFNIIITVGNHDAFFRDNSSVHSVSILNGWNNITVIDKLFVDSFHGKDIAFCPWGQDINEVPKCDLIFGHFEINSFQMNVAKVCTNGLNTSDLTSRAKLTISGHFHHRAERKYKDGTILYAGCPYQQDWGDFETTKGLYILDLDNLEYEFIENTVSPRYVKLAYSDLTSGNVTAEMLKSALKGNIVKFIIDEKLEPAIIDTIVRKLVSTKPTEFTIEYNYAEISKVDENAIATKDFSISVENSINEFIDTLEVKHKDKVKTYVTELYHKSITA